MPFRENVDRGIHSVRGAEAKAGSTGGKVGTTARPASVQSAGSWDRSRPVRRSSDSGPGRPFVGTRRNPDRFAGCRDRWLCRSSGNCRTVPGSPHPDHSPNRCPGSNWNRRPRPGRHRIPVREARRIRRGLPSAFRNTRWRGWCSVRGGKKVAGRVLAGLVNTISDSIGSEKALALVPIVPRRHE